MKQMLLLWTANRLYSEMSGVRNNILVGIEYVRKSDAIYNIGNEITT